MINHMFRQTYNITKIVGFVNSGEQSTYDIHNWTAWSRLVSMVLSSAFSMKHSRHVFNVKCEEEGVWAAPEFTARVPGGDMGWGCSRNFYDKIGIWGGWIEKSSQNPNVSWLNPIVLRGTLSKKIPVLGGKCLGHPMSMIWFTASSLVNLWWKSARLNDLGDLRKEFNVNTEAAFLDLKLGIEDWSTIGHQRSFWWPFEQEEWYITVTRGSGTIHGYIMLYI